MHVHSLAVCALVHTPALCAVGNSAAQPPRVRLAMQLVSIKAILAIVWILAVSIAGFAANLKSPSSWAILAAVALLPPIVMMWWWKAPPQTMSESIQEARR